MLNIRLSGRFVSGDILALPVGTGDDQPALIPIGFPIEEDLADQLEAFLADSAHTGRPGKSVV